MEHHVGIAVSLQLSSLCVLDTAGKAVREAKVASEREALVAFLRKLELPIARVGLEAGPLSHLMPVEALWRWLRGDVTYHHCHATADDLT